MFEAIGDAIDDVFAKVVNVSNKNSTPERKTTPSAVCHGTSWPMTMV